MPKDLSAKELLIELVRVHHAINPAAAVRDVHAKFRVEDLRITRTTKRRGKTTSIIRAISLSGF